MSVSFSLAPAYVFKAKGTGASVAPPPPGGGAGRALRNIAWAGLKAPSDVEAERSEAETSEGDAGWHPSIASRGRHCEQRQTLRACFGTA